MDLETWCLPLDKMALTLMHVRRKLPLYFQAHTVYVLIEHPLHAPLRRLDFMGRIAKWDTKLGSFDVRYRLRNAIKGQVLADFVAEFTSTIEAQLVCLV